MLEFSNISKIFGKQTVLNYCSFSVKQGSICGLLGLNGAGKSTLLKIVCSLVTADQGQILYNGLPIQKKDVGFMIEGPAFYPYMTGRQNLTALSKLFETITKEQIDQVMTKVGLSNKADIHVKNYSLGMKQRLYFAYAILNNPKILILDEPFNGVDPVTIKIFEDIIKEFAEQGHTILISGHMILELQSICNSVVMIDRGKVVYTTDDISGINLQEKFLSIVSMSGDAQ